MTLSQIQRSVTPYWTASFTTLNAFNQNHLLLYRRGLDTRYGPGTADALEERYRDSHFKGKLTKEWSKREYEAKIEEIKERLAGL
jgi:hypothetical protein